jgi:4-amino-4-deoxy-L-arabinose transferase-like glycosyltransferase
MSARLFSMSERTQRMLFFVFLTVIALGAMATLYVSTTAGLGFGNDSVAYVGAARNILDGNGYARTSGGGEIKPITHYPPLFSLALAAGSALIRYDPIRVARALIIFLWGLSAFLGGWLVWRMSHSAIAGLAFAFLFAANGPLLFVYAVIMSEPLYLALTFAAFLFLFAYFNKLPSPPGKGTAPSLSKGAGGEGWPWLLAAGAVSGLTYLTRYSGLALLATFAAVLLLVEPGWKTKLRSALVYLAGAAPFLLAWTLRNTLRGLSIANRTLSYHPIPAEKIDYGVRQVWNWLIPGWFGGVTSDWPVLSILRASRDWPGTPYLMVGLVVAALLVWLALTARRLWGNMQNPHLATFFTSTLYLFIYLAAILFSMFFFDASTPFRDRILAPIYISLLTAFVLFGAWLWRTGKWPLRVLVVILALSVASVSVADAGRAITRLQADPLGFASARWRNSKLIAAINALPPDTILYSNSPTAIYILTNRPAYIMPTPIDPVDNQPRGSFEDDVAQMRADLLAGKVALVVFQPEMENHTVLAQLTDGIPLFFKAGDGQIFGKP